MVKNEQDRYNMKKAVKITLTAIIALLLISVLILMAFSQRIVMNPAGTVGNTAGNLNNDGLFCEYNGKVYFYNSFDGGGLFSMDPNEENLKQLNTLEVRNILAGGKYLYYLHTGTSTVSTGFGHAFGMKSFLRSKLNGSNSEALTNDVIVTGQLVDNYLYLLTSGNAGPSFYKMKIDGSDQTALADYVINPACAENGIIYYNGTQNEHYLYGLDTATDTPYEVWKGNLWYPVLEDDYFYYLDVANNYRLCRYSKAQNVIEVLTEDRVDCFNVGGGYIYYQKNGSAPQLKCMLTDGSSVKVVAEGNYHHISMTSQYVYFQEFGNDVVMYHSQLGSDSYDRFLAAENAVQ